MKLVLQMLLKYCIWIDDNLEWAKAIDEHLNNVEDSLPRDCNGTLLIGGDSITLIKDLNVKGSSLNAKLAMPVRNIRLDPNNSEFIKVKQKMYML